MPKLNQVNALVAGRKSEVQKAVSEFYHLLQKEVLFEGRIRRYQKKDETGENFPDEKQNIQMTARQVLNAACQKWVDLFDLVATQDAGNQLAKADIVVEGVPILQDVPVTTLLFLEKHLDDVKTLIEKLPTPDPAVEWKPADQPDVLKSEPSVTYRTKKVPRNHVKFAGNEHHAPQVEVYTEDMQVGSWNQILFTGKILATEKTVLLARVKALRDAVKVAREQANSRDVSPFKIGKSVFEYILGPVVAPTV